MNWALDDSSVDRTLRPPLPAETSFNKEAVRGGYVFVKLHLENGGELLFAVDTGSPITILDKSLEPILGKSLGTAKVRYRNMERTALNVYKTPKLYLGNTQLLAGNRVFTDDFKHINFKQPVMGILGIDCLRHYCIQLDFAALKMRFLNPDDLKADDLGKAFPIIITGNYLICPEVFTYANFFGSKRAWLSVDTGCPIDAELSPELFHQVLAEQTPDSTNQARWPSGVTEQEVFFSKIVFNHESYSGFVLACSSSAGSFLGLRFMARHLVTLNFPKRMMYLQRQDDFYVVADDLTIEAEKFLSNQKEKGQTPGYSSDDHGELKFWIPGESNPEVYPVSRTFNATKNGDTSKYHYLVSKVSKDGAWKLQRAWQTGADGRVIKEYPIP